MIGLLLQKENRKLDKINEAKGNFSWKTGNTMRIRMNGTALGLGIITKTLLSKFSFLLDN